MLEPTTQYSLTIHRFILATIAMAMALILSTIVAYAAGTFDLVDPLPPGCVRGTPAGEDVPICCLSGFVYLDGEATENAEVTIYDVQGEIGKTYTKHYQGVESKAQYYFDLSSLKVHELGSTRAITPGDVITLVASYNGYPSPPIVYQVQPGGQRLDINYYRQDVIALQAQNTGQSEQCKFSQITAADVDSQGNLYVWDYLEYRMQIVKPDGSCLDFPAWHREPGSALHQVGEINSIAIDRHHGNDRVYLADKSNRRVAVYTADGEFLYVIPQDSVTASDFPELMQVHTDSNGNLYINHRAGIQKLDITGTLLLATPPDLIDRVKLLPFDLSTSGEIYLVNSTTKEVLKLNTNLQPVSFTISITTPTSIKIDDKNNLFIFDQASFRLYEFDQDGNRLQGSWEPPTFTKSTTVRIAVDQQFVYLVSQLDGLVFKYSKQGGSPIAQWGGPVTNPGSIVYPRGIAIAPDQSLFIADTGNGLVSRMVNNVITKSWGAQDLGITDQWLPVALTFDAQQRLWVTTLNGIQRFRYEPQSQTLVTDTLLWNGSQSATGAINYASAIATDKNGFVYITDFNNHRVLVLQEDVASKNFSVLDSISTLSATATLSKPFGIVVDDRDTPTIYVSDQSPQQIVKLRFANNKLSFVEMISSPGSGPQPFKSLYHLAMASDGALLIPDYLNGGIYRLAPDNTWHFYGNVLSSTFGGNIGIAADTGGMIYLSVVGTSNIRKFKPLTESDPVATIVHLSDGDLFPDDTLTVVASGQDGDESNVIVKAALSTASGLSLTAAVQQNNFVEVKIPVTSGTTTANTLGSGLHWLQVRVQDNEGVWSQPVSTTVYVAERRPDLIATPLPTPDPKLPPPQSPTVCPAGGLWTMLLYLDADNSKDGEYLLEQYHESLEELQKLNHACVQVEVQIDGPGNGDTERWLITPTQSSLLPLSSVLSVTEQAMDTPKALSDFIRWGQQTLPADHYYLAIADHGNAYQGIAFDYTSDSSGNAYLTASELRRALTAPGVLPIDVLHLDACSMALLDVAYDLREQAKYLIASQYIGWSFFAYADYASYITQRSEPKELAKLIANRYANMAEVRDLPYTISAMDLARIEPLKNGIDKLASKLGSWLNVDTIDQQHHHTLFDEIRNKSQFFDSNANYLNTPRDAYVDLKDFVERVKTAALNDDVTDASSKILEELARTDGVIWVNRRSFSGKLPKQYSCKVGEQNSPSCQEQIINMENASGISLYYPAEGAALLSLPPDPIVGGVIAASTTLSYTQLYADYIDNQLFDFTQASRWNEFLVASYGEPPQQTQLLPPTSPLAPATESLPQVALKQSYQLQDNDHNQQPSIGDVVQFEVVIGNQSAIILTNVSLLLLLNQSTNAEVASASTSCQPFDAGRVLCAVADIAPKSSSGPIQVNMPVTQKSAIAPEVKVFVKGVEPALSAKSIFLPLVMK